MFNKSRFIWSVFLVAFGFLLTFILANHYVSANKLNYTPETIIQETINEEDSLKEEPTRKVKRAVNKEPTIVQFCLEEDHKNQKELTAIEILGEEEYHILAKLLYAEAGGMTWEGQVYTCSAALNLSNYSNRSIWNMAHDINTMSVAPYVDNVIPNVTQYEVIEYVVCDGGRVPEICYWRTGEYHSFGTPVCCVDGHYFSKP